MAVGGDLGRLDGGTGAPRADFLRDGGRRRHSCRNQGPECHGQHPHRRASSPESSLGRPTRPAPCRAVRARESRLLLITAYRRHDPPPGGGHRAVLQDLIEQLDGEAPLRQRTLIDRGGDPAGANRREQLRGQVGHDDLERPWVPLVLERAQHRERIVAGDAEASQAGTRPKQRADAGVGVVRIATRFDRRRERRSRTDARERGGEAADAGAMRFARQRVGHERDLRATRHESSHQLAGERADAVRIGANREEPWIGCGIAGDDGHGDVASGGLGEARGPGRVMALGEDQPLLAVGRGRRQRSIAVPVEIRQELDGERWCQRRRGFLDAFTQRVPEERGAGRQVHRDADVLADRRQRAARLGRYPRLRAAARTRAQVSGWMSRLPFSARSTVPIDTPRLSAMSLIPTAEEARASASRGAIVYGAGRAFAFRAISFALTATARGPRREAGCRHESVRTVCVFMGAVNLKGRPA